MNINKCILTLFVHLFTPLYNNRDIHSVLSGDLLAGGYFHVHTSDVLTMAQGGTLNVHELIQPLSWLLGKWRSENGQGYYPTIDNFSYIEELEFVHVGQPNLQFSAYSWHSETKKPLHREVGFVRRKPNTNLVAFVIAHNLGVCEIEEGTFTENEINVESHSLGRLTFGKDPETKKVARHFKRDGDTLEMTLSMETVNTPMTEHLKIKYTKI